MDIGHPSVPRSSGPPASGAVWRTDRYGNTASIRRPRPRRPLLAWYESDGGAVVTVSGDGQLRRLTGPNRATWADSDRQSSANTCP